MMVFYVQNKVTRMFLNAKGGWSRSVESYRLAKFNSEEEALNAFPEGVECQVVPFAIV